MKGPGLPVMMGREDEHGISHIQTASHEPSSQRQWLEL